MQKISFFTSLKNKRAIQLLFTANFISGIAQGMSMIAIPSYLAIVVKEQNFQQDLYLVVSLVAIFWGVYAGVLVDRFDRKKIMLIETIIGAMVLISVGAYGQVNGGLSKEWVGLIFAFTFFVYNIHYPNLYAFAQEITAPKDYGRITSMLEVIGQFTTALAGALAAILLKGAADGYINLLGFKVAVPFEFTGLTIQDIFLIDGLTYIAAGTIIFFIRYEPVVIRKKDLGSVLSRLKTGIRYLWQRKLLWGFGLASFAVFLSVLLISFSLLPIYIANHLKSDSSIYATAEMYFAIGSALAGLFILSIFKRLSTTSAIIILSILGTAVLYILLFNKNIAIFYVLMGLFGLANAGIRIFRITYLFNRVPNDVMGRVGSVLANSGMAIRVAFAGVFALNFFTASTNILYAFLILAIFVSLATGFILFKRKAIESI